MIELLIGLIIGGAIGSAWRELHQLYQKINNLSKKVETKSTVTYGLYKPANETKQTPAVVNPKSPQRIQWEAEQSIRNEVLNVSNH